MAVLCNTLTWVDPDGGELVLASFDQRAVLQGAQGRGMPPIVIRDETVPLQPGARLRYVNHGPRDYAVPWAVWADDPAELDELLRAYLPLFDPNRGDGVLRIDTPPTAANPAGLTRELTCRYISGAERNEAPPNFGVSESEQRSHQAVTLVFRSWDPYWYGPAVSGIVTPGSAPTFFPMPNERTGSLITLTASEVFAVVDLANAGDVDAMPVWTVTGPGTGLVLTRQDTGARLAMPTLVLAAGEVATIDTRRYVMTAELADGTNLYPYLSDDSDFWWLPRGTTEVQIELSGATGASGVGYSFMPPYLTV